MKTKIIGLLSILLLTGMPALLAYTPTPASFGADTLYIGNDTLDTAYTTRAVHSFMDAKAQFPGGEAAFNAYIQTNFSYPLIAKQQGIEGRVVASVHIDETGKITSVQLLNDIGGGCADEVERILSAMPAWIPEQKEGRFIASQKLFTFTFKL